MPVPSPVQASMPPPADLEDEQVTYHTDSPTDRQILEYERTYVGPALVMQ